MRHPLTHGPKLPMAHPRLPKVRPMGSIVISMGSIVLPWDFPWDVSEVVQSWKCRRSPSPPGTNHVGSRNLGTGGTQSFQPPRYPGHSWDSVLSDPTLETGGTTVNPFRLYPGDWRDSVLSAPLVPWRLARLKSFPPLRYPGDWRDSNLSGPLIPWGLARLSPFRPPGTLGTGGTQYFRPPQEKNAHQARFCFHVWR